MARFRGRHKIHDLLERIREQSRKRIEGIRERAKRLSMTLSKAVRENVKRETEKARAYNEKARERQLFNLRIDDIFFKVDTLRSYTIDLIQSLGVIDINKLRDAIIHGLSRIRQINLANLYSLERLVARFRTGPCNSYKFYVRVTYATKGIVRGLAQRLVLYIRNWVSNAKLRDRLLNAIAFVIHALLRSRTKSRGEDYNSEYLANTDSTLDDRDQLEIMRSDITNTSRVYSLGFLMRHLSFIARALPIKLGLAEYSGDGHHCSVYAHRAEISKRKHYRSLEFQRYYDFIIYPDRERFRGIK